MIVTFKMAGEDYNEPVRIKKENKTLGPNICTQCPVARLVNRVIGGRCKVSSGHDNVSLYKDEVWIENLVFSTGTPYKVADWIRDFDISDHGIEDELTFTLDIPDEALEALESPLLTQEA